MDLQVELVDGYSRENASINQSELAQVVPTWRKAKWKGGM
jgi:hypothetical protein